MLFKDRGTTLLALLTLALGIGATATLFSFAEALYFRGLPVPDANRIVHVYEGRSNSSATQTSLPDYLYYRDRAQAFHSLAAHYPGSPLHVVIDGVPQAVMGSVVTASYFDVLGLRPQLGRLFTPEEDAVRNRDAVAVISHGLWQRRLRGDATAIGRSIVVNGRAFTVVGVAPERFVGASRGTVSSDIWIPSAMFGVGYRYCDAFLRDCTVVDLIGRLKSSVTIEQAESELSVLAQQLNTTYPRGDRRDRRQLMVLAAKGVYPAQQSDSRSMVQLLLGGVGLLLLIACANVAGLMLARGLSRRKEITVRLALGASRSRVVRQMLTESALLAAIGGALGLIVAWWSIDIVSAYYGRNYSGFVLNFDMAIGWELITLTVVVCGLTAIACGITPALQAARTDVAPALKREGPSGQRQRTRSRDLLVMAQIAMSIVLLVGAGLLVRSILDLSKGPGIDSTKIALLRLRPSLVAYSGERAHEFQRAVIERLESLPGVEAAATAVGLPVFGFGNQVTVRDQAANARVEVGGVLVSHVGDGYLEVLGLPLVAGRDFNLTDRSPTRLVAIADTTLAAALGGPDRAVGRMITFDNQPVEIVGVAAAAQFRNILEPAKPYLYLNYWQQGGDGFAGDSRTHVRVAGDATLMLEQLRREIAAIDPNVPISEDYSLRDRVNFNFRPVRFTMALLVCFSSIALVLSMVGLYGVVSSVAWLRRREVAVRLALGATPRQVRNLLAGHGVRLALPGVLIGIVGAYFSARLLQSLLYGVGPHDLETFVLAPAILLVVSIAATYVPVRRAMHVDPAVVLRDE